MKSTPVSLQLWSINTLYRADYAAAIKAVAGIGFDGVEAVMDDYGSLSLRQAADAITSNGLRVSGLHIGLETLDNDFKSALEAARAFGTTDIIVPWAAPETYATRATCEAFGERLDVIGARLRDEGLSLSFHNHAPDVAPVDGRPALEWSLDAAAPRNLSVEPDVYWLYRAGVAPDAFIRRQGSRVRLIHLKDGTPQRQCPIGRGEVDMRSILQATESIGTVEWLVIEQEDFAGDPLAEIRLCREQLKQWLP